MAFMAFLVFRKETIGKFFLILTAIFSVTVLLMHVHYSIDVFSAFFITYGVYKFCGWVIGEGYLDFRQASKQTSKA
jgi:membrane-associated phospholipid phosphatase